MFRLPDSFPALPEFPAGEVWLTGAGPGDPRFLTLLAAHAVSCADVVVHDALVDVRVLQLARPDVALIPAGKRGGRPSPHQRDINEVLIEQARKGLRVLRLKGGDPFLFGRGWDEAVALTEAGIRFRIIPGVTSGLAATELAGIPATTRDTNHAVVLAAGHRAEDGRSTADWEALGRLGHAPDQSGRIHGCAVGGPGAPQDVGGTDPSVGLVGLQPDQVVGAEIGRAHV